jgi:hypothetical protein
MHSLMKIVWQTVTLLHTIVMGANQAGAILEALGVNEDLNPASPMKQRRTGDIDSDDAAQSVENAGLRMVTTADSVSGSPDLAIQ